MKIPVILAITLLLIYFGQNPKAQNSNQQRRLEEEKRASLLKTETPVSMTNRQLHFDYGGWFNYRYIDYDNDDNDASQRDDYDYVQLADTRLWLKTMLNTTDKSGEDKQHSIYLRLKNLFIEQRPEDLGGGYDWDGPHLEYLYASINMKPFWVEAGRQYLSLGRGIAYGDIGDGVQLWYQYKNCILKIISSKNLPRQANIDTSIPGYAKKSNRYFHGAQVTYNLNTTDSLYGFFLIQRDYSKASPADENNYAYNSQYFAFGTKGEFNPYADYWLESIYQSGTSYIFDQQKKTPISAWAGSGGIGFSSLIYAKPRLELEYSYGSGDADRTNVTDTVRGNSAGRDKNFLYFGYLPSSYALSPRLSNIHIRKLGISCFPLENSVFFKKLKFEASFYNFAKDKAKGGIYDPQANLASSDIGNEIDFEIAWEIFSDLRFIVQYGCFYPGGAYPRTENKRDQYASLSLTITF